MEFQYLGCVDALLWQMYVAIYVWLTLKAALSVLSGVRVSLLPLPFKVQECVQTCQHTEKRVLRGPAKGSKRVLC